MREPIPTWFFVVVAVRKDDRWLLVHETKHGQRWYFPAGRVEPGEDLLSAARRETLEEAGIQIEFDGIIRIEHTAQADGTARCRLVLLAHPADDTPPKSVPDDESLESKWFTLPEVRTLRLRGEEVYDLLRYLSDKPVIAPLSLLAGEGLRY